jgi:quinol monooxygenase YgiN
VRTISCGSQFVYDIRVRISPGFAQSRHASGFARLLRIFDALFALTERISSMAEKTQVALWVRLEAKPGKEKEVADFLRSGLALVQQEPATVAWFGVQLGPSTFGIFDAFPNEAGRQAHLSGGVATALMASASELLAKPPEIHKLDVLASKLPEQAGQKAA